MSKIADQIEIDREADRILNFLSALPAYGNKTCTRAVAQKILLTTNGYVLALGRSWEVVCKSIGAGVYRITLKEQQ